MTLAHVMKDATSLRKKVSAPCYTLMLTLVLTLMLVFCQFQTVFCSPEDIARIHLRSGLIAAQQGNLPEALADFEAACRAAPFNPLVRANLANAHNNLGVQLMQQYHPERALRHFQAAQARKPEDIGIRMNLLATYLALQNTERILLGIDDLLILRPDDPATLLALARICRACEQDERAQELLEHALDLQPDCAEAHEQLGTLHYLQRRHAKARYHFERSLEAPEWEKRSKELLARLDLEESAEHEFEDEQSRHFRVAYQPHFTASQIQRVLEVCEEAYQRIGAILQIWPEQKPLVIVHSRADFQRAGVAPHWAGGLYDGRIRLPIDAHDHVLENLWETVAHEYTHHLIGLLTRNHCPVWLNEGLAQLMEGAALQRCTSMLKTIPTRSLPQLRHLETAFSAAKNRTDAEIRYGIALLAVGILHESAETDTWHELLTRLGRKEPMERTLQACFRLSLADLEKMIRQRIEEN